VRRRRQGPRADNSVQQVSTRSDPEGTEDLEGFEADVPIRGKIIDADVCEVSGGRFLTIVPMWMMPAYVAPDFDPRGGVFAMFNPSIWPHADSPDAIRNLQTAEIEGAVSAPITNFDFGDITVDAGESIVFSNGDLVPHTVTAGTPNEPAFTFDSGVFGTGESYELSFDEVGDYDLFCVLHPQMTATVTVE